MTIIEMQKELAKKDLERNGFTVEMRKAHDKIQNKLIAIAHKQREVERLQEAIAKLQKDIDELTIIEKGE